MRLLHRRNDDAGAGAAAEKFQADRRADPRRAGAASVSLWHAYAYPARGASRRGADANRRRLGDPGDCTMSAPVILDRRRVLAGGGALIVSFSLGDVFAQDQSAPAAAPPPSPPG